MIQGSGRSNKMMRFAFVNKAAEREYKKLPKDIQDDFGKELRHVQYGQPPVMPIEYLDSIGAGVIELKINGSPAFRCIYVTKYLDTVVVLHSFSKTTNSVDRKVMKLAEKRLKEMKRELK